LIVVQQFIRFIVVVRLPTETSEKDRQTYDLRKKR
jgi:CRISPR/Cas system-associated protein endoribonuclease Cas2